MIASVLAQTIGPMTFLAVGAAIWAAMRHAAQSSQDELLPREMQLDGTIVIPVTETMVRGGFFARSRNSINPSLSTDRDGIRFHVLKKDRWLFSEIERIDARKSRFGVRIIFARDDGYVLTAHVRQVDIAKRALAALSPDLPFTAEAAALRDSTNTASSASLG